MVDAGGESQHSFSTKCFSYLPGIEEVRRALELCFPAVPALSGREMTSHTASRESRFPNLVLYVCRKLTCSCSVLQVLLPLIVCGASVAVLLIHDIRRGRIWGPADGYRSLPESVKDSENPGGLEDESDEDDQITIVGCGNGRIHAQDQSLQRATSRTTDSVVEVSRPKGEVQSVVLEELAVGLEVAIHLAALLMRVWGPKGRLAAAAGLISWTYIFLLVSVRLLMSATSRCLYLRLWNHTVFLYLSQWLFTVIQFRSAIIHPRSKLAQALVVAEFLLLTVLASISLGTRKGNKPIVVEHEPGLEPSKEPLASIFSRATFGWVDPIVWRGYKKTLELSDVWDLAPKDKAATILQDFRQIK